MSRGGKILLAAAALALGLAVAMGLYLVRDRGSRAGLERVAALWLETQGARLHVDAAGPGKPLAYWRAGPRTTRTGAVILLHGAGGDAATSWFRLLPALARQRPVLALQLPYARLAESAQALENFFWEQNQIIRLMDRLGLERASLVGLSAGAWVASLVAMNYPQRLERLVLISPMGLETEAVLGPLLQAANPGKAFLENMFHSPPPLLPLFADALAEPVSETLRVLSRNMDPAVLKRMDLAGRLSLIRCPTLVISGAQDRIIPPTASRALAAGIPGARLLTLEDCGHAVVWDQPARLEQAVRDFLEPAP